MKPQDLIDTREGAKLERWSLDALSAARPQLLRVVQKSMRLATPPDDSWLGRVDARTNPFQSSEQIRVLVQVAADNLREVDAVLKNRPLPMFAVYSMVRSAMESSSIALWILDAKSEDLAASRTLRVYRQNIESDRTLWKTVVSRESGHHSKLAEKAEEVHQNLRGIDHAKFECAVKSTDVIQMVDRAHPSQTNGLDVLDGLEVWRLCSAVTHANQVSMINIMERHPVEAPGVPPLRTSRMSFVVATYTTALNRANAAIDAFQRRSLPRRRSER